MTSEKEDRTVEASVATKTLLIASPHVERVEIEELHVNCWVLGSRGGGIHVEIGLESVIKRSEDNSFQDVELQVHLPLPCDGNPENLTEKIAEGETAKLLFNEKPLKQEVSTSRRAPVGASVWLVNRVRGSTLLLVPSELRLVGNAVHVVLHASYVDASRLPQGLNDSSSLNLYFRFRYRVQPDSSANSGIELGLLRNRLFLDLRVNELRLADRSVVVDTVAFPRTIRVFLIHPLSYQLISHPIGFMQYSRLLECGDGEWSKYFSVLKKLKRGLLIHQWRFLRKPDGQSREATIAFLLLGAEKSAFSRFGTPFLALIFSGAVYLLLGLPNRPWIPSLRAGTVAAGVALFLALIADAVYDVTLARRYRAKRLH